MPEKALRSVRTQLPTKATNPRGSNKGALSRIELKRLEQQQKSKQAIAHRREQLKKL
jgi:hypothetical protein